MQITLYAQAGCPACRAAKDLLHKHHLEYAEINTATQAGLDALYALDDAATHIPQVVIDGRYIGGLGAFINEMKRRGYER